MEARAVHLAALLLAATGCGDALAQTLPPPNDLEVTGRPLGPLPLRLGRASEFEVTFTNRGPTSGRDVRATGRFPWVPSVLFSTPPGAPCGVDQDVVSNPPDPAFQYITVYVPGPIPVGSSIVCRFRIEPVIAGDIEPGRSLTLFATWGFTNVDPDPSNNEVTLGMDPAATSIPALGSWWAAALALLVAMYGLRICSNGRSRAGGNPLPCNVRADVAQDGFPPARR